MPRYTGAGYPYSGPSMFSYGFTGFQYASGAAAYLSQDNAYLCLQGPRYRETHYPIGPMALGYHHGDPRIPNLCPSRISDMRITPY